MYLKKKRFSCWFLIVYRNAFDSEYSDTFLNALFIRTFCYFRPWLPRWLRPTMKETRVRSLGREGPLEGGMATTPVFLMGEFHGQRSLVGYSPWGHKQLDTTERLTFWYRPYHLWIGFICSFLTLMPFFLFLFYWRIPENNID